MTCSAIFQFPFECGQVGVAEKKGVFPSGGKKRISNNFLIGQDIFLKSTDHFSIENASIQRESLASMTREKQINALLTVDNKLTL
jgi:hypothetical protein